ncbi:MAG: OmpA family protein [Myxococcales bacterium]|nr:OmpA family protein [Myxococcales bacterium]
MKTPSLVLSAGLLLAIVAGCAHQADRAPAMVRYEASQEAQESEIIRERNPELYNAAEVEHANAIKAERAEEYEATAHHAEVAVLLWRTAEARSHTVDAEARQATAERRYAAGEAALEAARAERDEETLAIARLQEIIKLQKEMDAAAKAMAAHKQSEKVKAATNAAMLAAMAALKDAEAVQASVFAAEAFAKAQNALTLATATLQAGDLGAAQKHAEVATAAATEAKQSAGPKFEADRARRSHEARAKRLFEEVKQTGGERRVSERGVEVTLRSVFEPGEIFVAPIARSSLEKVAELAKSYGEFAIIIEAHTDSRGGTTANLTLSQSRADAVLSFLTKNGVSPSRITAIGKGSAEPIADNRSQDGRAANRRVEITFVQPPPS